MGYYDYQSGLIHHHINQEEGWVAHQQRCRSFILKALELYNPSKITVLGSGWLLELPFAEMLDKAKEIVLIDIIHPPDVVNQVKDLATVRLVEQDVTGGLIEEVWLKTSGLFFPKKIDTFNNILIPEFELDDPGLVISLNILTQLEVLPLKFIRKSSKIAEEEILTFRSEIQKMHISFLRKHKSVIISDCAEVLTGKDGIKRVTPTLLTELPSAKISEEWTWNFDKAGGELYNSNSQFKVIAQIY